MDIITTDLPLGSRQLHDALNQNFEVIAKFLGQNDFEKVKDSLQEIVNDALSQKFDSDVDSKITQALKAHTEQLQKEIRAIVMPAMSPLEVTDQVETFKTDSHGIKHLTISERLASDFSYFIDEHISNNDILKQPIYITDAGTISLDYFNISSLSKAKKIGVLGDGIAAGQKAKYGFGDVFHEKTGVMVHNLAVDGSMLTNLFDTSIFGQSQILKDCDVVFIQLSSNDWSQAVEIGDTNSLDDQTFIGSLLRTINNVAANNPDAKIFVLLALPFAVQAIGSIATDHRENTSGRTLKEYMDAAKLALNSLSIPYLDLLEDNRIIEPLNPAVRTELIPDGFYPNEIGHQVIAQEMAKYFYYFYK